MALVAVETTGGGLVTMSGLRIDGGDHPVLRDPAGNPEHPIGALVEVLADHRREQPGPPAPLPAPTPRPPTPATARAHPWPTRRPAPPARPDRHSHTPACLPSRSHRRGSAPPAACPPARHRKPSTPPGSPTGST